jgi:hypothetical protein
LVQVSLVIGSGSSCSHGLLAWRPRALRDDEARGRPPVGAERGRRRRPVRARLHRQLDHAALERVVPERVEAERALAAREHGLAPEIAQVRVVAGGRLSRPAEQRLLGGARPAERAHQRLAQAEVAGHRLRVPPALEEVVVGADGVRVRAGLVPAIAERDGQRHLLERLHEVGARRVIVGRVRAPHHERVHLAAVHLLDQRGERGVVPLPLQRRAIELHGGADVPKQHVDRVDHDLRGDVVAAAHHQRLPAVLPQLVDDRVELVAFDGIRHGRRAGRARLAGDAREQGRGDRAQLRRRHRHADVGVAARDRHPRLDLDVKPRPSLGLARARVLPRELHRRQPGPEEVRLEPDDHARPLERVVRDHRAPERLRVRGADGARRHGVVHDVTEAGVALAPLGDDGAPGRAGHGAGQEHDLRLPRGARAAAEQRRFVVPVDLDGAAVPLLHEQAARRRAAPTGGGVVVRHAGHDLIGAGHQRHRVLHRGAAGGHARRRHRETHERQEISSRRLRPRRLSGRRLSGRRLSGSRRKSPGELPRRPRAAALQLLDAAPVNGSRRLTDGQQALAVFLLGTFAGALCPGGVAGGLAMIVHQLDSSVRAREAATRPRMPVSVMAAPTVEARRRLGSLR